MDVGDTVIGLSTSGNSTNIINAFEIAKQVGRQSVALLGRDGGRLTSVAEDLAPFAAMNADADVLRYYSETWTKEQSDAFAQRVRRLIGERGWRFWTVEKRNVIDRCRMALR